MEQMRALKERHVATSSVPIPVTDHCRAITDNTYLLPSIGWQQAARILNHVATAMGPYADV